MVDRVEGTFQETEIRFMDNETVTIQGRVDRKTLDPSFQPDNWSVICGRGKQVIDHIGNRRLKVLVEANLATYSSTKSTIKKTLIVSSIIDTIRTASPEGGFVKQCPKTKLWMEVGCDVAREKVGQLLRELMAQQDPAKREFRREQRKSKARRKGRLGDSASSLSKRGAGGVNLPRYASTGSDTSVSTSTTSELSEMSPSVRSDSCHQLNNSCNSLEAGLDSMNMDPLPIDTESPEIIFSFDDIQFEL